MRSVLFIATALLMAACQPPADAPDWSGKWMGPEGTYMTLQQNNRGTYDVAIRDLDGERVFNAAHNAEGVLEFTRDGVREKIVPGNGAQTGMKWLADKHDCLVIRMGEGYCCD
mgnify:CR=1 FL=1